MLGADPAVAEDWYPVLFSRERGLLESASNNAHSPSLSGIGADAACPSYIGRLLAASYVNPFSVSLLVPALKSIANTKTLRRE